MEWSFFGDSPHPEQNLARTRCFPSCSLSVGLALLRKSGLQPWNRKLQQAEGPSWLQVLDAPSCGPNTIPAFGRSSETVLGKGSYMANLLVSVPLTSLEGFSGLREPKKGFLIRFFCRAKVRADSRRPQPTFSRQLASARSMPRAEWVVHLALTGPRGEQSHPTRCGTRGVAHDESEDGGQVTRKQDSRSDFGVVARSCPEGYWSFRASAIWEPSLRQNAA